MHSPVGLTVRQAISIASALLLTLTVPLNMAAQDESPPPTAEPDAMVAPVAAVRDAPLTVGPWHLATIDDAPDGHFVRGVAAGELGLLALGNLEFGGPAQPAVWTSDDGMSWERATFAKDARRGLIEAAVSTPDGWVAVGRDFPEQAYAWTSPDGRHWQAADMIESAKGHLMYDVAATPRGLVAVGCKARFHCSTGVAWISQDGRSWEVLSKLPIQLPTSVTVFGDEILVAGFSDGYETNLSKAVTASSANGRKWKLDDDRGPQASGFTDLGVRDGEALAFGYHLGPRAADDVAVMRRSPDGRDWTSVAPEAFDGWSGIRLATADDVTLTVGTMSVDNSFIAPVTFSSADLETWTPGTFADGLRAEQYHVLDTAFAPDGDKAVMVGAIDHAPAIWWADIAPVGSPEVEPAPVTALGPVTPGRFQAASVPEGDEGVTVKSVIPGGPGYIAVGGGSADGADARALVWTSTDGLTWDDASLADDARSGVIEAVAPLAGAGYVAVGNDSTGAQALVWRSADGTSWERAETPESFAGAVVHDLVVTAEGVAAVGCEAYPDCRTGLVWTTSDGLSWELGEELALTPYAAGVLGSSIAAGGTDSGTPDEGRAVIATSGTEGWDVSESLGKPSSRVVDMDSGEEGLVAAAWQQHPGQVVESAIIVSVDGQSWDPLTHKRLKGMTASAIELSADGVLLTGTKSNRKTGTIPLAFWTRDLQDFETIRFPKDVQPEGLAIEGSGMAADGSMALAVGTDGDRPAIWYSLIE